MSTVPGRTDLPGSARAAGKRPLDGQTGPRAGLSDIPPQPTASLAEPAESLRADPVRIAADLEAIARIGGGEGGVTRPGYSPLERQAHELVGGWLTDLGLTVWGDAAGNTIAELPAPASKPALGTGSHLDSVPGGGRFDGVVGVVGAVEVVRMLRDAGVTLGRPLRVVCFAAEEGARFGQACLGSRAVAGIGASDIDEIRDEGGVTRAQAMREVGLDPTDLDLARWDPRDWAAFLELHVEQGTVLESQGVRVGVVDLVSGSTRLELELHGRASHSGGTPMTGRSDALAAAAEIVTAAEHVANDPRHRGTRATIGRLQVAPGNITTIPGHVVCTLDVRDVDSDRQRLTVLEMLRRGAEACARRHVSMSVRLIGDTSPAVLPIWVRRVVTRAARAVGVEYRVVTSGASHDAQSVNTIVPAGIIFVPSRAGLSHVAEEWTDAADIAMGTDVLARSLIELDGELAVIEGIR
ncbi:MAG: Zn-dependent hydrolase [Actinomycetota bacterium]|nr:Zn-dependent hydrolase [Actinomycetota bacterium]